MKKQWIAGLAVLMFAGGASAQDLAGNFFLAVDNLGFNLDTVLTAVVTGDVDGAAFGVNDTVGDLVVNLSADTPLESLAMQGADLGTQVTTLGEPVYAIVEQLIAPGVTILAPLSQVYLDQGAFDNGFPFINGRDFVLFQPAVVGVLESFGLPVGLLAGPLTSGGAGIPVIGELLGGNALFAGIAPLGGDLLSGDGIPVIGDLLGGDLLGGGIPVIGGLLGGGLLAGGIPVIGGLLSGLTLPGLGA
ncbi:MAG: hypothetical protein L0H83_05125 [Salinisphaera sp.]|nr:hypothetical protein [Salinisphaera sp.]